MAGNLVNRRNRDVTGLQRSRRFSARCAWRLIGRSAERFGSGSAQRSIVADRLARIYQLAVSTGQLARFIVFGSFITAKPHPNDTDILLLMEDTFDLASVTGE
ncbi:MAG: DUF6932 family protein, partial [Candidatus Binatia bacterium]